MIGIVPESQIVLNMIVKKRVLYCYVSCVLLPYKLHNLLVYPYESVQTLTVVSFNEKVGAQPIYITSSLFASQKLRGSSGLIEVHTYGSD